MWRRLVTALVSGGRHCPPSVLPASEYRTRMEAYLGDDGDEADTPWGKRHVHRLADPGQPLTAPNFRYALVIRGFEGRRPAGRQNRNKGRKHKVMFTARVIRREGGGSVLRWLLWEADMPAGGGHHQQDGEEGEQRTIAASQWALALHYAAARGCLDCTKLLVDSSTGLT
ncbi:hypothetical protein AAG570_006185 [Ranatra chinensis]|uniref:Uncharacterized protein n=1 Tax=Ranatra chinensis TaxID=642074 RepID=A0ABD0XXA7_9HEMI